MNFAEIDEIVFEISCLQEMITHTQADRRTDTTEYMISRRCTAAGWPTATFCTITQNATCYKQPGKRVHFYRHFCIH